MRKYKFKQTTAKDFFHRHGFSLAVTASVLGLGIAAGTALTALNADITSTDRNASPVDQIVSFITDDRGTSTPTALPSPSPTVTPTETPDATPTVQPIVEPTVSPTEVPALSYPDYFFLPVNGTVTKDYSDGLPVLSVTLGDWRAHNGVDIGAQEGDKVSAAANGVVLDVRYEEAWGWIVDVDHGGNLLASYRCLGEDVAVKKGDTVSAGQTIGSVGAGGYEECGQETHLHFEMTYGGRYVDPIVIMDKKTA